MCLIQQARINLSLQQVLQLLSLLNTRTSIGRVIDIVLSMDVPIVVGDDDSDVDSDSYTTHRGSTGSSGHSIYRPAPDPLSRENNFELSGDGGHEAESFGDDDDELSYLDPSTPTPPRVANEAATNAAGMPSVGASAEAPPAHSNNGACSPQGPPVHMHPNGAHAQDNRDVGPIIPPAVGRLNFIPGDFNTATANPFMRLNLSRPYSAITEHQDEVENGNKRRRVSPQQSNPADSELWYCVTRGRKAGVVFGRAAAEALTRNVDGAAYFGKTTRPAALNMFLHEWFSGRIYSVDGDFVGVEFH